MPHGGSLFADVIMTVDDSNWARSVGSLGEAIMNIKSDDILQNNPEWKRQIAESIRVFGIVPERFTGQVIVVFNQGGVMRLERREHIS